MIVVVFLYNFKTLRFKLQTFINLHHSLKKWHRIKITRYLSLWCYYYMLLLFKNHSHFSSCYKSNLNTYLTQGIFSIILSYVLTYFYISIHLCFILWFHHVFEDSFVNVTVKRWLLHSITHTVLKFGKF